MLLVQAHYIVLSLFATKVCMGLSKSPGLTFQLMSVLMVMIDSNKDQGCMGQVFTVLSSSALGLVASKKGMVSVLECFSF